MNHSVNFFSRIMLGLLAVFYVSIFVIQATHIHKGLNTAVQQEEQGSLDSEQCRICAYFAYHDKEEIATSISFAPTLTLDVAVNLGSETVLKACQTYLQDFTNRGPPCLLR